MTQGIVRFKTDDGRDLQLSAREVTEMVCPQATPQEVALFLRYCEAHRLDPIGTKDAYLVKYGGSPATMITGYQVFNRRAKTFPDYRGIKSGVVVMRDGRIEHKQGNAVYKQVGEELIGGWAEVYVDGWEAPVYSEVDLSAYSTGRSNWSKMPGVMIEKVAKSNAWRTAYPDEFANMYTSKEMGRAAGAADERPAADVRQERAPADVSPIRRIFPAYANACFAVADKAERYAAATRAILDRIGADDMSDLTEAQVRRAVSFMEEEAAHAARQEEAHVACEAYEAYEDGGYETVEEF